MALSKRLLDAMDLKPQAEEDIVAPSDNTFVSLPSVLDMCSLRHHCFAHVGAAMYNNTAWLAEMSQEQAHVCVLFPCQVYSQQKFSKCVECSSNKVCTAVVLGLDQEVQTPVIRGSVLCPGDCG